MKYEEVDEYLCKTFPNFAVDEYAEGLPYCVAGMFAFYLLAAYRNNSEGTLLAAGKFIEELFGSEYEETRNLALVGYLEAIQNVWGNNGVNPEEMVKYLEPVSKRQWIELNRLWDGDITASK